MTGRIGLLLAATALSASACAAAGGVPETSDTPRRDLAERPTPIAGAPTSRHGPSAQPNGSDGQSPGNESPGATTTGGSRSPGTATSDGNATTPAGTPAAPFHSFASLTDGTNDAGLDAPPYADLRSITLRDNGADLRVEVVMNASLPARTGSDETMGIGVDLYRRASGRESAYQLFADGEPDGWFAYLDTPRGFVRFPGTFGLGGNRLVFTVPWSAVGNLYAGRFSAFADWTRRSSGLTGNKASNDFAPIVATKNYSR